MTLSKNEIDTMITRSLDLLPDPYAIRTLDSRHIYANRAMAKLTGLKSVNDIIDRVDYEIPSLLYENEDSLKEWRLQDKKIVESRQQLAMLEIHPDAIDSPYICRKVPFYNKNGECIGAFCTIKYIETFSPNDFVKGRFPGSLLLNKPDDIFTEKECEIIFFKLQRMSSKEIGKILNISHRTIEKRLLDMYQKIDVNHFEDFRSYCESRNLHRYIPTRILNFRKALFDNNNMDN